MDARFDFIQIKLKGASIHKPLVVDMRLEHFLPTEDTRKATIIQHCKVDSVVILKKCVFIQILQHSIGVCFLCQVDFNQRSGAGEVIKSFDAGIILSIYYFLKLSADGIGIDTIRNFGNYETSLLGVKLNNTTQLTSKACAILHGFLYIRFIIQNSTGGKVWGAIDFIEITIRIVNKMNECIIQFAQIILRYGASHTNSNPLRAVHYIIISFSWQYRRILFIISIVITPIINGILVDIVEKICGKFR